MKKFFRRTPMWRWTMVWLALAVGVEARAGQPAAVQSCLDIEWNFSEDSNAVAMQAGDHIDFASINGKSVYFDTLPGSIRRAASNPEHVIHSISRGCFGEEHLKIGVNEVSLAWVMTGLVTRGSSLILFKVQQGNGRERELCRLDNLNGGSCKASFKLSLQEISPETADRIAELRQEMSRLERELERARAGRPTSEELKSRLDVLLEKDLDQLSEEDFAAVSSEVADLWELVKGLRGSLDQLQREYQEKLAKQRDEISGMKESALAELEREGINVDDESLYDKYFVDSTAVPKVDLAEIAGDQAGFDPEDNVYLAFERSVLASIERAVRDDDMVALLVVRSGWLKKADFLVKAILMRDQSASGIEMKVLSDVIVRVNQRFGELVDSFGFKRNSVIPEETRRKIETDLAPVDPQRAEALRDALNTWEGDAESQARRMYIETLDSLIDSVNVFAGAAEAIPMAMSQTLSRMFDPMIDMAKQLGRAAVDFSPVGDYVDLCEAVTGRDMCLPGGEELTTTARAFAFVGLFIGSRMVWTKVGDLAGKGLDSIRSRFFRSTIAETSQIAVKLSDEAWNLLQSFLKTGVRLSKRAREYVTRLAGSGQWSKKADLHRIALRYMELEPKFVRVPVRKSVKVKVWRGKRVRPGTDPGGVFDWAEKATVGNHRYSVGGPIGQPALYGSIGSDDLARETVLKEMRNPPIGEVVLESKDFEFKKVLDLTDKATLEHLGIAVRDITKRHGTHEEVAYELTQQLGHLADKFKFDAMIVPSAEAAEIAGVNVVIFKR